MTQARPQIVENIVSREVGFLYQLENDPGWSLLIIHHLWLSRFCLQGESLHEQQAIDEQIQAIIAYPILLPAADCVKPDVVFNQILECCSCAITFSDVYAQPLE